VLVFPQSFAYVPAAHLLPEPRAVSGLVDTTYLASKVSPLTFFPILYHRDAKDECF
jgi:hypothetical protein